MQEVMDDRRLRLAGKHDGAEVEIECRIDRPDDNATAIEIRSNSIDQGNADAGCDELAGNGRELRFDGDFWRDRRFAEDDIHVVARAILASKGDERIAAKILGPQHTPAYEPMAARQGSDRRKHG
jgi:hypothetical protein